VSPLRPEAGVAQVRKARGAFFTPPELCDYIVEWAVRSGEDLVLEPSCGEAAFLLSAGARLDKLARAEGRRAEALRGVELHEESARAAATYLLGRGYEAEIDTGDFFSFDPTPRYDAVVGNPPYVRYQDFTGESRSRSRAAALRAGVPLTGLASSWAAFTIHAALFLKPEGRLGLVLPAELLTVNYAAEVRKYLMQRFARVRLVLFTERVFPGVLEEVVLLLADGVGPTDHCQLYQVRDLADLRSVGLVGRNWRPERPEGKWTPSLLPPVALKAYSELFAHDSFTTLDSWGDTTLGMVTGNNRYFAMSPARAKELGLRSSDLIQLSPPGSSHLRGLVFSQAAWKEMGAADRATMLFRPSAQPSKAGMSYIEAGEALNVHKAYKCQVRKPWWRVPLVEPADVLLTYMNADTPRLCSNKARVYHLNSVHGLYLRDGMKRTGQDYLPIASLNSMTLLGAETVGRSYGGGMLKLEPREADELPVPTKAVLEEAKSALTTLRPQMAYALRSGRLLDAVKLVDEVLLVGQLGIARSTVRSLREAHAELSSRRTSRGAPPAQLAGSLGTHR
jgi:adenine-specific DNA-methyltransferase